MSAKVANSIVNIDEDSMGYDVDENTTASKARSNLVVIPVIPKPLAVFCLVANIFLPGSGTMVSAFSVFCFYHKKEKFQRMASICVWNILTGLCQLITVMFVLIGWVWSIVWGCALVGHSNFYKQEQDADSQIPVVVTHLEVVPSHLSADR